MAEEEVSRKEEGVRRKELTLEADFTLGPDQVNTPKLSQFNSDQNDQEDVACVDLEDGWPEDAVITRHADYNNEHINFVRWIQRGKRKSREKEERDKKKEEKEKRREKETELY